jgi:hypothetical protein
MTYLIKFSTGGYFSTKIDYLWNSQDAPKDAAYVFNTMREARKQLNRLNGRLLSKKKNTFAEIVPGN